MQRSLLAAVAFVCLSAAAGAQSKTPAAPAAAAAAKPAKPEGAAQAPSAAAKPGAAAPKSAVSTQSPKPADARNKESLEEIVARVKRRLAEQQQTPVRSSASARPRAAEPSRVELVWRPGIVWPAELHEPIATTPSDARVQVQWQD